MTIISWFTDFNERLVSVSVDLRFSGRSAEDIDCAGLDMVALDTSENLNHLLDDKDRHWLIADAVDRHLNA